MNPCACIHALEQHGPSGCTVRAFVGRDCQCKASPESLRAAKEAWAAGDLRTRIDHQIALFRALKETEIPHGEEWRHYRDIVEILEGLVAP